MIVSPLLVYLGASTVVGIASRLWVVGRRDLRARRSYASRLFDESALTRALSPESADADDQDVLDEMAETLSHLNRQFYAAEMWNLSEQLAAYYEKVPVASRATMERALLRMLRSRERWLTTVAAKTAARIPLPNLSDEADAAAASALSAAGTDSAARQYADTLRAASDELRTMGRPEL